MIAHHSEFSSDTGTIVLVWRVNERCNLDCSYCDYGISVNRQRLSANADQVAQFGQVLREYAEISKNKVMVSWLGGEPFLWPGFSSISSHFVTNFGVAVAATTNGTLLTHGPIRDTILRYLTELTISVDGHFASHSLLRKVTHDAYKSLLTAIKTLSSLRDLEKRRPLLRVNTVLTRQNIAGFRDFCFSMVDCGIDQLTFNLLGGSYDPAFFLTSSVLPAQWAKFSAEFPTLQSELGGSLRVLGSTSYIQRIKAATEGMAVPVEDCFLKRKTYFIDTEGYLGPCAYTTKDFDVNISNIRSGARLHAMLIGLPQKKRMFAPCMDCPDTNVFGKFLIPTNGEVI